MAWGSPGVTSSWTTSTPATPSRPVACGAASLLWGKQEVRIDGRPPVHLGGKYGYSMSRGRMQQILTDRASELGVRLETGRPSTTTPRVDADLVVAADGVGSRLRARHVERFAPTITTGRNRYIWLGTSAVLGAFTFAFERTDAGWVWAYGYPSTGGTSTFVVECAPSTWTRLGLDRLTPDAGLRLLESVFARVLSGHRLLEPPMTTGRSPWLHFREIRNATWRHGRVVLAGRLGAHHALRHRLGHRARRAGRDRARRRRARPAGATLPDALDAYDRRRRAVMGPIQDMAMRSMSWFEDVDARMDGDPVRVAYSLLRPARRPGAVALPAAPRDPDRAAPAGAQRPHLRPPLGARVAARPPRPRRRGLPRPVQLIEVVVAVVDRVVRVELALGDPAEPGPRHRPP